MAEKSNYHLHTTISDGKLSPEELVKLAIKKKFDTICITDHYSLPPGFKEKNNFYSENDYNKLKELKREYKGKINILVGVEFDWLRDYKEWLKGEVKNRDYDHKLVSMHFIKADGEYYCIDSCEEEFRQLIKKSGGIEKVIKNYFNDLREAVKTGYFDCLAHLDIIKIWNENKKYFSEEEKWYKNEVEKTLNLVKKKKMKIEINTSGWRKPCNEQYPSKWILQEAKNRDIHILIGSDGHEKWHIDAGIKEANKLLKSLK